MRAVAIGGAFDDRGLPDRCPHPHQSGKAYFLLSLKDSQFTRRVYVRAVFALIEGNINLMADVILAASGRDEVALTTREAEALRQERQITTEQGVDVTRVKFVPIRDRIVPVFSTFARMFEERFLPDRSTSGWTDFIAAIEIRNRITHPKNAASFDISDNDLGIVERAREWYAASIQALLAVC
ncbi:MAG: hypothetical protein JWL77_389 [Chthonomonadaceae bacterium]|nr:hypothetical protein [Chthonomonadaceae bacterium]